MFESVRFFSLSNRAGFRNRICETAGNYCFPPFTSFETTVFITAAMLQPIGLSRLIYFFIKGKGSMKFKFLLLGIIVSVFFCGCNLTACQRCKEFTICKKIIIFGEKYSVCDACHQWLSGDGLTIDIMREIFK